MTKYSACFLLSFFLLILNGKITGQNPETIDIETEIENTPALYDFEHSPRKATIYSAIFPGAGQFYNKKYWKLPIVYSVIGGLGYFIHFNHSNYKLNRELYFTEIEKETPDASFLRLYELNTDYFRRNRDLSVVILALAWGLNVIDAHVDAHFLNYDISPDISLRFEPTVIPLSYSQHASGIQLKLSF